MPETVETYQNQPAERSIFSASSDAKPSDTKPIPPQPQKTIQVTPINTDPEKKK